MRVAFSMPMTHNDEQHEAEHLSTTFRNVKTYKRRDTNNKYGPNLREGCRTKGEQAVASGLSPERTEHTARQLRWVNKAPASCSSVLIPEPRVYNYASDNRKYTHLLILKLQIKVLKSQLKASRWTNGVDKGAPKSIDFYKNQINVLQAKKKDANGIRYCTSFILIFLTTRLKLFKRFPEFKNNVNNA